MVVSRTIAHIVIKITEFLQKFRQTRITSKLIIHGRIHTGDSGQYIFSEVRHFASKFR